MQPVEISSSTTTIYRENQTFFLNDSRRAAIFIAIVVKIIQRLERPKSGLPVKKGYKEINPGQRGSHLPAQLEALAPLPTSTH
jgi:hypothetical protein